MQCGPMYRASALGPHYPHDANVGYVLIRQGRGTVGVGSWFCVAKKVSHRSIIKYQVLCVSRVSVLVSDILLLIIQSP
jgi:hypothetical protein